MFKSIRFLAVLMSAVVLPAQAALVIDITEGTDTASPIAIVPFGDNERLPLDIASVIENDLRLSGLFAPKPRGDMLARPTSSTNINYLNWRFLNVDHVVVGWVEPSGTGRFAINFELINVHEQKSITDGSVLADRENLRTAAHHIADKVYYTLTGQKGVFNTQVAYVTLKRRTNPPTYELLVADFDGYNPQPIFTSTAPIMSPAWSPDARRLAYVSFEGRRSHIYVQDLRSRQRELISARDGINGAPSFSPDGRELAMALSSGGNVDIYVYNFATQGLRRLTDNRAIDTEPDWSPNGRQLAFTSDRGGKPQIYQMGANGGTASRLTFEGKENSRPRYSSDGKRLAMVHGDRGQYRIAVLKLDTGDLQVLTRGRLDESPSFAPNGAILMYGSHDGPRGQLATVSVDGRVRQRLSLQIGDVREPAWSPFTQ